MVVQQERSSLTKAGGRGGGGGGGGGEYGHDDDAADESSGAITKNGGREHRSSPHRPLRSLDDFLEEAKMLASSPSSNAWLFNTTDASMTFSNSACFCSHPDHHPCPWRFWLIFISLGVANSSDATEILCLSYILSNANFNATILQETAWRAGVLAAAVFLGMLLGGLWVGVAGDVSYGRRPMLLLGLLLNSMAGILSALSVNVWMLALLRFLSGLGIGATVPPLFTLCSELAPARDRGFWVSVAASFWMVGSIYVAVLAWILLEEGLNWSWRIFAVASALPSAAGFVMVYHFVPESPRFLALQGNKRQSEEALVVVHGLARKLHYAGSEWTMEELLHQYPLSSGRHERNDYDHLTIDQVAVEPTPGDSWKTRVQESAHDFTRSVKLLYTPQLRQTTWPLQMVWFSLSFGSYGLMTWYDTSWLLLLLLPVIEYYTATSSFLDPFFSLSLHLSF
jgi:MFS family permease